MKRYISTILISLFTIIVNADVVNVNGINYELDSENKTASVAKTNFYGDLVLPSSIVYNDETYIVTSIGAWAFDCAGLTSAVIPNSVTTISYSAFFGCSNMESIVIPSSVSSIGSDAFVNCKKLSAVYISDFESWCSIKFAAQESNPLTHAKELYLNNELVKDVVIPYGITEIGNYLFVNYSNLTSIIIHGNVTSIGDFAFSGCSNVSVVDIPSSVTKIGASSFSGCTGLVSVKIGENVRTIGRSAFAGCSGLESIVIPDKVTWVGWSSFYKCTNLKKIYLGKAVTTIDPEAFQYCKSMQDFYSFAEQVPSLVNNSAFWMSSFSTAILHVPANLVESYKQSTLAWNRFGSIVALTEEETAIKTTINSHDDTHEYHNLNGQSFKVPQHGINIIRMPDGSYKKILLK